MKVAKVLVVDDDSFSRTLIASKIENELGAKAVQAQDGLMAMACLRDEAIDLAIVDLEMPGLDGFGLLGCMRGHPKHQHLPIVVVSGLHPRIALDRALEAGATSFLRKPLNWVAFGKHVRHLLHLSSLSSQACPSCGAKIA